MDCADHVTDCTAGLTNLQRRRAVPHAWHSEPAVTIASIDSWSTAIGPPYVDMATHPLKLGTALLRSFGTGRRCFASSSRHCAEGSEAASSSLTSSSSGRADEAASQEGRHGRRQRRASAQPSHLRSSQDFEEPEEFRPAPAFDVAPINWLDARYTNPAPPTLDSQLISPLPETSKAAFDGNPFVAVGPGATNATSLRYAERSLHLHLAGGRRQLGQYGTVYGVPFGKTRSSLSSKQAEDVLTREQRQQAFLEREGGDYSRYVQPSGAANDWRDQARHALNANSSVAPESKAGLIAQMGRILEGQSFGEPMAREKKKKAAAIETAPPPQEQGKKGKKGR
ncbi:unnamed protein product [Parajaminaea phylloscopi]